MCREGMFKMQLALKYINLVYLNDCVNDTTLCLTALAESSLETSSVKIGPVKHCPLKKVWILHLPDAYYII